MTEQARSLLPDAETKVFSSFAPNFQGWGYVAGDHHIPYHDKKAIEVSVERARKEGVKWIVLNGDIVDYLEMSDWDKDPTLADWREERVKGIQFLAYMRERFPKAEIVYKEGNHEERIYRYLMRRAPALFGLPALSLPNLFEFEKYGITHVGDKRVIQLSHLSLIHGHEYRFAIQNPVNPARGLFLRSQGTALCNHFHQTSEHSARTITGKSRKCWSLGAMCHLSPAYLPLNNWNHGFALVHIDQGGEFGVHNLSILDGKIL